MEDNGAVIQAEGMEIENENGSAQGPISNRDGGDRKEMKGKEGRGKLKDTICAGDQHASGKGNKDGKKWRQREPSTPTVERPARERKSIDRFVVSAEKEVKEFKIEKGAGTALKDIPNIVFKLSKRKAADDVVQSLHKVLYGKRVKPHAAKANILQFSGCVWSLNEEKEKAKVKERLEKCVRECLFQISDLLDLNLLKSIKKEDAVLKLFEFLESPHKTSDRLVEEKEQVSKVKKSKRTPTKGMKRKASGQTPRKRQKSDAKTSNKEQAVDEEDGGAAFEDDVEEEPEEKGEMHSDSENDDNYDAKPKSSRKRGRKSAKKQSKQENGDEKETLTMKKKPIQEAKKEEKQPKLKAKKVKEPTDKDLQAAICELLQDADFSKVTFTDVLKQLGEKLKVDFSHNKAHVKVLIQEEIAKIVDEGDNDNNVDEDDNSEGENDNGVAEDNGEGDNDNGVDEDNGEGDNDNGVDEGDHGEAEEEDCVDNGNAKSK